MVKIFPGNILSHVLAGWLKTVLVSRQNVDSVNTVSQLLQIVAQKELELSTRVTLVRVELRRSRSIYDIYIPKRNQLLVQQSA